MNFAFSFALPEAKKRIASSQAGGDPAIYASFLNDAHVYSAKLAAVFGVLLGVIGDMLALQQIPEPVSKDRGKVDENVLSIVVVGKKPKPFALIKPFDSTFIHSGTSCKNVIQIYASKKPPGIDQNESDQSQAEINYYI